MEPDRNRLDRPAAGDESEFAQTIAVITGSTGGIGRATVEAFFAAGCRKFVLHYARQNSVAETMAENLRGNGAEVTVQAADLARRDDRRRLLRRIDDTFGGATTWVHAAGLDVLTTAAKDWDFETKLDRLWRVDVAGTIELVRQSLDHFAANTSGAEQGFGSITLIGWDQSTRGMEGDAGQMFGPIKAAVTAFGLSLSQEVAPAIRVNVVAPGWIRTAWGEQTEGYWDRRAKRQALMGRWGTPQDVAATIRFVADPAQRFLTGQVLNVNGGFNRRYDENHPKAEGR